MSPSEFPYRAIPHESIRLLVLSEADAARKSLRDLTAAALAIGPHLAAVRGELSPPLYRAWLHAEFLWSEELAAWFVDVAQRFTSADDCDPRELADLAGAASASGIEGRQLERAAALLRAYREILRTDPQFVAPEWRAFLRSPRRVNRRPFRGTRRRSRCLGE
ncbi:MAG: hypothetical protein KF777_01500 [Planctomycetaceae bacterium]|nr:hypothetical protein [Planctomycetaceae bacterium]